MHFGVDFRQGIGQRVPVRFGRFPAAAETQHAMRFRRLETHRGEHVRRLLLAGRAGRAGRNREARLVEFRQPASCAAFGHERGNGVPQTRRIRADDDRAGQFVQKLPLKILAPHAAQDVFAARDLFFARFQRGEHRHNDRDIFRSGAAAAFLFAADQQRRDVAFVRDFQKTDAARPAEFVRRAAEKIAFAQVPWPAFCRAIARHRRRTAPGTAADGQRLAPGLDDAGLVVRGHDADEPGPHVGEFQREPVQVNHAVVRDGNEFRAFAEIMLRRFVDARMFDGGNPDLGFRVERPRKMVHDHVVGLGRAARPDDVAGWQPRKCGELFARLV